MTREVELLEKIDTKIGEMWTHMQHYCELRHTPIAHELADLQENQKKIVEALARITEKLETEVTNWKIKRLQLATLFSVITLVFSTVLGLIFKKFI